MNKGNRSHLPWAIVFDTEAQTRATADIDLLYPQPPGAPLSPVRRDILGWYQRWLQDLETDPARVLGAPPLGTDHPDTARFPADDSLPVSAIANVDQKNRVITIIHVRIRPPRKKP